RADVSRGDRSGDLPDPGGTLADRRQAAQPVVVPARPGRVGTRPEAGAAGAFEPARHALDGTERPGCRDPRHRRACVDRLQRLTRLHPHAGARGGVALRARPRRDAGRHSLGSSTPRYVSRTTAPVSATRPATISRGCLDSRTVSAKARPSRIRTARISPPPTINAGRRTTYREVPEAATRFTPMR